MYLSYRESTKSDKERQGLPLNVGFQRVTRHIESQLKGVNDGPAGTNAVSVLTKCPLRKSLLYRKGRRVG